MKFYNSNIGRAKLRRDGFIDNQYKNQFKQKSLSKHIIAERCSGITADNIDKECERIAGQIKADELIEQIAYHIKFYKEVRRASFDEDRVKEFITQIRGLESKFQARQIDVNYYIKGLEDVDKKIMHLIDNWENSL